MKDVIKNIIEGRDIEKIISYVMDRLFKIGPIEISDMEILTYLFIYQSEKIEEHKNSIINFMGIFYKDSPRESLKDVVFGQYKKFLQEKYDNYLDNNEFFTPVQADILKGIDNNNCFSFSAPTSTGKSFVFMKKILDCKNDVIVIVPSRALVNEYYIKLNNLIEDKAINILTFIDKINTKRVKRNVFVVTPERCRELFKYKEHEAFNVDLFLFDEAQLSNEEDKRGLYYDSIVRRAYKKYPNSKFVFAHPFISNPESQIEKNFFDKQKSHSKPYIQKNVGQIFMLKDNNNYYHFGIDKEILGNNKVKCNYDPIKQILNNRGGMLIYVSKQKIYDKRILSEFNEYISLCPIIENERIDYYVEELKKIIGGNVDSSKNYYSQMIDLIRKGVVIHHGSMPLESRILVEEFTKEGWCRICFATSTLEQGINMPFDIVFIDRLEVKDGLALKNLIGRAGRSTLENKFDFGTIVIQSNMSGFRRVMLNSEKLKNVSELELDNIKDDDYNDFKQSIKEGTFNDEFNLTPKELESIERESTQIIISKILNTVFTGNELISLNRVDSDIEFKLELYNNFIKLFESFLKRDLSDAEKDVLNTAIKIMLWRVHGKTFKKVCWFRYSHAIKSSTPDLNNKMASYITGFHEIPNKNLKRYPLYDSRTTLAKDVDYDRIVYDTYDYIDKLIGFTLTDKFYAAFTKYYERTNDVRANKLANYIKFGTNEKNEIWMLRYGLSFEDIENLKSHIKYIDSEGIIFNNSIKDVPNQLKKSIERYLD
ncbi:DEAD/DEAH box helicase [Flavobacterium lacisediminis]|uniref:DEAD/DEAH box helicase n=1 Tax=Flavobacterium lacisediminis TaxID=2989705 RepID=A0ABT3EJE8_9FLAO|nr:DEAD/DEAH box helicase [Flavobacterium lacisediminis]MCW1148698.1 DEAD/DEAH box helicase [Flavobacterium lacisediminis]